MGVVLCFVLNEFRAIFPVKVSDFTLSLFNDPVRPMVKAGRCWLEKSTRTFSDFANFIMNFLYRLVDAVTF